MTRLLAAPLLFTALFAGPACAADAPKDDDGRAMRGIQVEALAYGDKDGRRQLLKKGTSTTNDRGEFRLFWLDPDAIKTAVFALKPGELSEPVRQPNGFYLFRAEEVTYRPLSQARDEIFNALKQQHYSEWLEQTNKNTKVVYNSPAFLGAPPAQAPGK